jgi:hypothetical protein
MFGGVIGWMSGQKICRAASNDAAPYTAVSPSLKAPPRGAKAGGEPITTMLRGSDGEDMTMGAAEMQSGYGVGSYTWRSLNQSR